MGVLSCISDYLKAYGSELGYRVVEQFPPLHPSSDTVRWLLQRQLSSGRPDIPAVAREIGVSERTLQRRLQHEGTSFQFLLTAVRRARARELLANTALDFGEAAFYWGTKTKIRSSAPFGCGRVRPPRPVGAACTKTRRACNEIVSRGRIVKHCKTPH